MQKQGLPSRSLAWGRRLRGRRRKKLFCG